MYVRTHITEIKQNRNETLYTLDNDIYNRRPGSKKTNKKDKKKKKKYKKSGRQTKRVHHWFTFVSFFCFQLHRFHNAQVSTIKLRWKSFPFRFFHRLNWADRQLDARHYVLANRVYLHGRKNLLTRVHPFSSFISSVPSSPFNTSSP